MVPRPRRCQLRSSGRRSVTGAGRRVGR